MTRSYSMTHTRLFFLNLVFKRGIQNVKTSFLNINYVIMTSRDDFMLKETSVGNSMQSIDYEQVRKTFQNVSHKTDLFRPLKAFFEHVRSQGLKNKVQKPVKILSDDMLRFISVYEVRLRDALCSILNDIRYFTLNLLTNIIAGILTNFG